MTFDQLLNFIQNRMRMSHIYQPVMLTKLLESGGTATETEIATEILRRDRSWANVWRPCTGAGESFFVPVPWHVFWHVISGREKARKP